MAVLGLGSRRALPDRRGRARGIGSTPYPEAVHDLREVAALRVETALLSIRYLAYIALLATYATELAQPSITNLGLVTAVVVLHNGWVHCVMYVGRPRLFASRLNFAIHLAAICTLIGISGGQYSPLVPGLPGLLVGYALYARQFRGIYVATLATAAAYAFTLLSLWGVRGLPEQYYPIGVHFAVLAFSAWLLGALGEMVRTMELRADDRTQALASSEATIRGILNAAGSPIVVCDEHEFVREINNGAAEFLELEREAVLGQRFRQFLFDDGTLPNKLASIRMRGEYHGEVLMVVPSGEERHVELYARTFIRDNQRFVVFVLHDISAQKLAEETSTLAQMRLEQVNEQLRRVQDFRAAFLRTVSQKLRSPLAAVLGHVDMLLGEEVGTIDVDQQRALNSMRRSVMRVFELVDTAFDAGALPSIAANSSMLPEPRIVDAPDGLDPDARVGQGAPASLQSTEAP